MIEELKKIVTEEKDDIRRQYKAQIKAVFGSYARGDFHADSDLDLLVDFDDGANLFDMIGLQHFLEDKLGCKVDLGTESSLREDIRASVFSEMIRLS
jgi:predicted nucleotidyltransferase